MQALKFEGIAERPSADSALATFLIQRATANVTLGNYLLWFLIVESEDDNWSKMFAKVNARLMDEIVSVRHMSAPPPPARCVFFFGRPRFNQSAAAVAIHRALLSPARAASIRTVSNATTPLRGNGSF